MCVIGNNIALSLGMVGALTIVRFRTAIKDPWDTTYIFWVIAVGVCCGICDYLIAGIGSAVIFCLLLLVGNVRNNDRYLLIIRTSGSPDTQVEKIMDARYKGKARLKVKNSSADQAEYIYELSAALLALTSCAREQQPPVEAPVPALRVSNGLLVDEGGHCVALRGMSSHGLGWYPRYINAASMQTLKEYGANVIRLALYSETKAGYLEEPYSLDMLYIGIENAIAEDLYVIVDWHILGDGNPLTHVEAAEEFFSQVSGRYAGVHNVLYEICNEPNGDTSWEDITDYANRIIPVIRENTPDAVILVGTPKYSTRIQEAMQNPLPYENLMYSYHKYVDVSPGGKAPSLYWLEKAIEAGLDVSSVLYVLMKGNTAGIHVTGGQIYNVRRTLASLEKTLGDGFIKVHRGCIVSAMAIHDITDKINLSNGESLDYVVRKKKAILAQLRARQKELVSSFSGEDTPQTPEEYHALYSSLDHLPFAFADIEMVFDEEHHAVDWIFRYGNFALARLEKTNLERLIGSSFSSLFPNMDFRWLRIYERATLYGETLETIDYSPEIDTYLKVICFPTFPGHCGCILFDASQIKLTLNIINTERSLMSYFGNLPEKGR